jgi:hypothetical protein
VNKSKHSRERIQAYQRGKEEGSITLMLGCGDARSGPSLLNIDTLARIRSIAGSFDPKHFQYVLEHGGIRNIVIAEHYDGSIAGTDDKFVGCGGLGVKGDLDTRAHTKIDSDLAGVEGYVRESIASPNAIVQAYNMKDKVVNAMTSSKKVKPIMLALIDHVTGELQPFWYTESDENGMHHTHSYIPSGRLDRPRELRPSAVRFLERRELSGDFGFILGQNQLWRERIRKKTPKFEEMQRVQNPSAVVVTTSLIPLRNRYAGLFDIPNKIFSIAAPLLKENNRGVVVAEDKVLHQVAYPIVNAFRARQGGPFFNTRTIMFETAYLDESKALAYAFMETPFGSAWRERKKGKVIITEVKSGETTVAEEL